MHAVEGLGAHNGTDGVQAPSTKTIISPGYCGTKLRRVCVGREATGQVHLDDVMAWHSSGKPPKVPQKEPFIPFQDWRTQRDLDELRGIIQTMSLSCTDLKNYKEHINDTRVQPTHKLQNTETSQHKPYCGYALQNFDDNIKSNVSEPAGSKYMYAFSPNCKCPPVQMMLL